MEESKKVSAVFSQVPFLLAVREMGGQMQGACKKWFELVWKPYIAAFPTSFVPTDDFTGHKRESIIEIFKSRETFRELIPSGFTCVLQTFKAAVMRSLKRGIRKIYMSRVTQKYIGLTKIDNLPTPDRRVNSEWVKDTFDQIQDFSMRATLERIRCIRPDTPLPPSSYLYTPFPNFNEDHDYLEYSNNSADVNRQEDLLDKK